MPITPFCKFKTISHYTEGYIGIEIYSWGDKWGIEKNTSAQSQKIERKIEKDWN